MVVWLYCISLWNVNALINTSLQSVYKQRTSVLYTFNEKEYLHRGSLLISSYKMIWGIKRDESLVINVLSSRIERPAALSPITQLPITV